MLCFKSSLAHQHMRATVTAAQAKCIKCHTCASVSSGMTHVEWTLNYFTCFWNTRMKRQAWKKNKGKRDVEKKKGRQLHGKAGREGREGRVETLVVGCEGAYKPNSALMVNGGLRWHVPSHGIFYSLSVPCSCCCVFLLPSTPPPPMPSVCFFFVLFFCGWLHWLKFIVLDDGF